MRRGLNGRNERSFLSRLVGLVRCNVVGQNEEQTFNVFYISVYTKNLDAAFCNPEKYLFAFSLPVSNSVTVNALSKQEGSSREVTGWSPLFQSP